MRRALRELLPSMFHRRLLLLTAAMLVVLAGLGAATAMLATGQTHAAARSLAESKLSRQHVIQTKRGAIVDRQGRVLAEDDPGWELAVHFDLLTGKWAYKQAYADASADKLAWGEMSEAQREARVDDLQREYEAQAQALYTTLANLSGQPIEALLDRRSGTIERIQRVQNYLWRRWQQQASEERGEPVPLSEVAKPIKAQTEHHVLIRDVSEPLRLQIERFIDDGRRALNEGDAQARPALPWTMVELRRTTVRRYPRDRMVVELDRSTLPGPMAQDTVSEVEVKGVGLHLIGLMRDVWKEDVGDKPLIDRKGRYQLSGYADGDRIGRSGIEQSMEHWLRGSRGLRTVSLTDGQTLREIEPSAGRDVTLTIDINLQAHVQAVMSPEFGLMQVLPWHLRTDDPQQLLGATLNGSAVVMDVASGDVLAAVSMPEAPRDLLEEDPELLWNDAINHPMVNRAVAVPYQPGSTLKPLVLAATVSEGLLGENELIDCKGYLWENKPNVFRDWYWKMYGRERGPINGVTAIEVSNNPFFGHLAKDKLIPKRGLDRLPIWYQAFGFGERPGTGLAEEIEGAVGIPGEGYENNEVCFMAIGQGPVAVTPLQSALAFTRLASADLTKPARLVASPRIKSQSETAPGKLSLTTTARRMALEGMRRSANSNQGTTHHISHPPSNMNREPIFNVDGVTVMAKSGTADPGSRRWIDFNRDGEVDPGEIEKNPRDHAWVVALVQPEGAKTPTHAIACVVEYAGSGGRVAGPVVNQIIHALKRHGYLDWPPTR